LNTLSSSVQSLCDSMSESTAETRKINTLLPIYLERMDKQEKILEATVSQSSEIKTRVAILENSNKGIDWAKKVAIGILTTAIIGSAALFMVNN